MGDIFFNREMLEFFLVLLWYFYDDIDLIFILKKLHL
jgi:hypothetical protein